MSKTGIEWTEQAWNPISGCTPVSPGCLNCYAATMAVRLHGMTLAGRKVTGYGGDPLATMKDGRSVFTGEVRLLDEKHDGPLRRRVPTTYFVNSMSDLFHESVPFEFIDRVFAVMALCRQHTFQVLTKRAERMAAYLAGHDRSVQDRRIDIANAADRIGMHRGSNKGWTKVFGRDGFYLPPYPLPNVWIGVSAEDQTRLDERIDHLLACPAAVRFLSCEPLLGPILLPSDAKERGLGWVIVGGESGAKARPCHVGWVRDLVNQCRGLGIPVFVKQLGRFVVDRNDAGFDAEDWVGQDGTPVEKSAWPCSTLDVEPMDPVVYQGAPVRVRMRDSKGKVMAEWPVDLRVREVPVASGLCGPKENA